MLRSVRFLHLRRPSQLPIRLGRRNMTITIAHQLPEEADDIHLKFASEPLGVSPELGYGYPQLRFGARVGPGSRYEIVRKLGWGASASIWLAHDTRCGFIPPSLWFRG
jgi:hypothetical protein